MIKLAFYPNTQGWFDIKINKCDKLHGYLIDAKKGFLTKSNIFHVKIPEGTSQCGKG